jgi:hypothetical protein
MARVTLSVATALAASIAAALIAPGCQKAPPADATPPTLSPSSSGAPAGEALKADDLYDVEGRIRVDGPRASFVGHLIANEPAHMTSPSQFCLEDGSLYEGAPHRLGRVNVFGLAGAVKPSMLGKTAIVFGERRPSLDAALKKLGPCPEDYGKDWPHIQMRSDWVSDEGGFRTTREKLRGLSYIQGAAALPVKLHEAPRAGAAGAGARKADSDGASEDALPSNTTVFLLNPFNMPIEDLRVRVHYEGGPGKPMPHFEERRVRLAPGERVQVDVASAVIKEAAPGLKGGYRLESLDVEGKVGRAEINATLFIRADR